MYLLNFVALWYNWIIVITTIGVQGKKKTNIDGEKGNLNLILTEIFPSMHKTWYLKVLIHCGFYLFTVRNGSVVEYTQYVKAIGLNKSIIKTMFVQTPNRITLDSRYAVEENLLERVNTLGVVSHRYRFWWS